jgi:uncharacterized phiE125 gp8 family phage protein
MLNKVIPVPEEGEEPTPIVLAVTVDELKNHLRIELDETAEDDLLISLILSSTAAVEKYIQSILISSDWEYTMISLQDAEIVQNNKGILYLPLQPVQSVTGIYSIAYSGIEDENLEVEIDPDSYVFNASLGYIIRTPCYLWPSNGEYAGFKIKFSAGYGTAASDIPSDIREAVLRLAASHYSVRSDVQVGKTINLTGIVRELLSPYVNYSI